MQFYSQDIDSKYSSSLELKIFLIILNMQTYWKKFSLYILHVFIQSIYVLLEEENRGKKYK